MPQMPDPVSRCPIFERLEKISSDPDLVNEAIIWMKRYKNDFIAAGKEVGILVDDKCWHPVGNPTGKISEIDYLTTFFFPPNGWWQTDKKEYEKEHGKTFEADFSELILTALKKSSVHSELNEDIPVPIQGYWECVGTGISMAMRVMAKRNVIWMRVQTPPPEEEYVCTP